MTAIVGVFGARERDMATPARSALTAMHPLGSERVELWHDAGAALGAVSNLWQVEGDGEHTARLAFDDHAVVVTDASLYYIADLKRALTQAGRLTASQSPAALALAAYRAWGPDALHHLEGDFALIVWDRRERRLLAGRDFSGTRPLFYAPFDGGLAIASRLDGLAALPGFDATLDLMSLGNDALFLRVQAPESTVYAAAKRLPASHRLDWREGTASKVEQWWDVPIFVRGDGPDFDEAAEELRRLTVAAVSERTRHTGGSAIWLSGGYDSPTLFAASHVAAAADATLPAARAVSLTYPPDDPGCEDDFIAATTTFWNVKTTWVDATAIPAIEAPLVRARLRDEPLYHTYELWNATLARATREQGLRIALIGNGGDQFFSSSVVRLADHFRTGRLISLAREWREAGGGKDWKLFVKAVVAPNLPPSVLAVANSLRYGRTLQHRLARLIPSWANTSFEHFDALTAMNRTSLKRRPHEGHAALEQSWSLRQVTSERIHALLTTIALMDGVEVRSPLFDGRIIQFAAGRPLAESYSRRENKRLLRGAFRGLLPETVLGPRTERTGLPVRYLKRTAVAHAQWITAECCKGMILADMGVIDGRKFLDRARAIPIRGFTDIEEGASFVATAQAEFWLRARK